MDCAVLFIVFNRPDTTSAVFETIRKARPTRLYVAADGPRIGKSGDQEQTATVREIVCQIDWPCRVQLLFREENLGCKIAVSSAIDWFFAHEEMGIILEDDCLPHATFFSYCHFMLEWYKHDERIMMIAGSNNFCEHKFSEDSYFYSQFFHIWGWATWRRAWQKYDVTMGDWPQLKADRVIRQLVGPRISREYYDSIFDAVYEGRVNTWDYQWVFACLFNSGLSIVPRENLVSNIGVHGVHSSGESKYNFRKTAAFLLEDIRHPTHVFPRRAYEIMVYRDFVLPAGLKGEVYHLLLRFNLIRPARHAKQLLARMLCRNRC